MVTDIMIYMCFEYLYVPELPLHDLCNDIYALCRYHESFQNSFSDAHPIRYKVAVVLHIFRCNLPDRIQCSPQIVEEVNHSLPLKYRVAHKGIHFDIFQSVVGQAKLFNNTRLMNHDMSGRAHIHTKTDWKLI